MMMMKMKKLNLMHSIVNIMEKLINWCWTSFRFRFIHIFRFAQQQQKRENSGWNYVRKYKRKTYLFMIWMKFKQWGIYLRFLLTMNTQRNSFWNRWRYTCKIEKKRKKNKRDCNWIFKYFVHLFKSLIIIMEKRKE